MLPSMPNRIQFSTAKSTAEYGWKDGKIKPGFTILLKDLVTPLILNGASVFMQGCLVRMDGTVLEDKYIMVTYSKPGQSTKHWITSTDTHPNYICTELEVQ